MRAPAASAALPSSIISKVSVTLAFAVVFGIALAAVAVRAGWGRDFASFYYSAAALAEGLDPYRTVDPGAAVNINLPHATALLVPLSALPFPIAFTIWQLIQLTAWTFLLWRLIRADSALPPIEFVAASVLFPGTLAQIAQGQWGFLLALLLTMAWFALRRGGDGVAGVWIGMAVALKPFVALLIIAEFVRGRVRLAVVAAFTAAIFFSVGTLLLGITPYVQWLDAVGRVDWAGYPSNASLRGLFERSLTGQAVAWWPLAAVLAAGASLVAAARCEDDALSWTLVLAGALLAAPVGWLYYGWILAPSLLALRDWPVSIKVGLVVLWIPPGLAPILSTATAGLLLLWSALLAMHLQSRRVQPRPVTPAMRPA